MPARHTSLQDVPLLQAVSSPAALVDERGCRRDIRSNGWIVLSREFALAKTGPAEEASFLRSVRISGPQFHRAQKPAMKSGPDVFADALVPLPWLSPARQILKISRSKLSIRNGGPVGLHRDDARPHSAGCRLRAGARGPNAANGYRFAKRQGKPNCRIHQ
jgi:hypothetical protein